MPYNLFVQLGAHGMESLMDMVKDWHPGNWHPGTVIQRLQEDVFYDSANFSSDDLNWLSMMTQPIEALQSMIHTNPASLYGAKERMDNGLVSDHNEVVVFPGTAVTSGPCSATRLPSHRYMGKLAQPTYIARETHRNYRN
jgi:hypothetical protein